MLSRNPAGKSPLLLERCQRFVGMVTPNPLVRKSSGDVAGERTQLITP
jgi:hypothetical protein